MTIFTVGHSTRPIEDFLDILRAHEIQTLIDVRTIPKSRHNPQFGQENLRETLKSHRIGYRWMKELGGLRKAKKDSINTGFRNASFRGYADYMQTPEFEEGLKKLMELGNEKKVAILCAEAVPWRC